MVRLPLILKMQLYLWTSCAKAMLRFV